jgi:hypothetical protein
MTDDDATANDDAPPAGARGTASGDDAVARDASPPTMPRRRRRALRWLLAAAIALVVLPVAGFAAWSWVSLTFSFSEGKRVGYVQKFSRKGWVCKTWEGELAMNPVPGAVPQLFAFSVREDAVAREIERAMGEGRPVSLDYREHRGVPSRCFGETDYFVVGVRAVGPPAPAPAPAAPAPTPASATPR